MSHNKLNFIQATIDSIFLTKQRKTLIGTSILGEGIVAVLIGILILCLPANDYEPVKGKLLLTDQGYVLVREEIKTKKEEN